MVKLLRLKIINLLHWSEKYTKTDMVYLTSNGFWSIATQIISMLTTLIVVYVFANYAAKELYGQYKFVLSIVSLLAIFTLTGTGVAIMQSVARGFTNDLQRLLKSKIIFGLIGALLSIVLSGYYFYKGNHELSNIFLAISIFIPFFESFFLYNSYLQGKKDFKTSFFYVSISTIIQSIALLSAIFITTNIIVILAALFISQIATRAFFFYITLKNRHESEKDTPNDKEVLKYSKHLSAMGVVSLVANHIDKILVFHYLGAAELAVYAVAILVPEQIKEAFKHIYKLAIPKYAKQDIKNIKKNILKKMLIFGLPVVIIISIYILIAPYFYSILFPKYLESIFLSQIFAISILAIVASLPIAALQAKSLTKQLYKYNLCSYTLQIVFIFIGIYYYGLIGLVIARVVSRLLTIIISFTLIKVYPNHGETS